MRQISEMSTQTAFLDRRDVLKLGIAGSMLAVGGATATSAIAQLLTLPIRPDVAGLARDQVDALRTGVAVMKQRDPGNPTSWH